MGRSMARQAAMQLLYGQLSGGEASDESLELAYEQLSTASRNTPAAIHPTPEERRYIRDILEGVQTHMEELDGVIQKHSSGDWALSRVSYVDLSILRLCAYELFYREDIPNNVSISEAMELAECYSEPKSSRYINGVLGAINRSRQDVSI
ncbi:MAG: transcription antitermination factor NusB [Clostridia bacterium]|nr:transcription antitermination factor NusB [Clostridia bacterium]